MAKQISSPLVSAFNRIGNLGASKKMSNRLQSDFSGFINFLEVQKLQLESEELPSDKKIKALATLNIASTFGKPTNLLNSLASGALDVAGFLGNFFPSRQPKGVKPPKPVVKGPKLKLGGIKALGVVNALFAGLDFATGLQEGESAGKAAAGAGGSLAGSLLGGAIGQALIPVPGVGFVLGSMAGGFLGGYAADRAVEMGQGTLEQKQKQRLKAQEIKQKSLVSNKSPFTDVMDKFDGAVVQFEKFVSGFSLETNEDIGPGTETDTISDTSDNISKGTDDAGTTTGDYPGFDNVERVAPFVTGSISDYPGAQFGASREGKRVHAGQDIKDQKAGDPVLAAMAGEVIAVYPVARLRNGSGMSQGIEIKHPDGTYTRYVHVIANVGVGVKVKTGQQIAKVSPDDYASTAGFPHLHFELRNSSNKALDPRPFLRTSPKSPSIVPIKKGTPSGSSAKKSQDNKFTANDLMSAPMLTIGDSIAKGSKDSSSSAGTATVGASPKDVMGMLQNQDLKGKLIRLSSGISNDTSDLATVRQQLQYAQKMGAKGVQLMGTSVDRGDLAAMNPKLQALAQEFPGFVQFAGGFNAADKIHPNYEKYNQKMQSLLRSSSVQGMGGPSVDVREIETKTLERLNMMQYYPTYNQAQSSVTVIPIAVGSNNQQKPVIISGGGGGSSRQGGTVVMPGPSSGELVNHLFKTMLLTNLSGS